MSLLFLYFFLITAITVYLTFDLHRCFLITFYFTQELLPSIAVSDSDSESAAVRLDEAIKFVKTYGAYLTLHLSLVCAAMMKVDTVIDELLALAKHDPRHREVSKDLSKTSSLVLYDSVCFPSHILIFSINLHVCSHKYQFDRPCCLQSFRVSRGSGTNQNLIADKT